ncbi:carbohydrate-binding protein [Streptomyces sp. NPDC003016]
MAYGGRGRRGGRGAPEHPARTPSAPRPRSVPSVVRALCTDQGAPGSAPLTGERTLTLRPEQRQAEHAVGLNGPQAVTASSATGGERLGDIQNGERAQLFPVSPSGVTGLEARVSSGGRGGGVSLRPNSPTGSEIPGVHAAPTGSWDTYTEVSAAVSPPDSAVHDLYAVFTGPAGGALLDLDAATFTGPVSAGRGVPHGPRQEPAVRQVPGHQPEPERDRRRDADAAPDPQRQRCPEADAAPAGHHAVTCPCRYGRLPAPAASCRSVPGGSGVPGLRGGRSHRGVALSGA